MLVCRNGRRGRVKICCPYGRMGSSPITSTILLNGVEDKHMNVLQIVEKILNITLVSFGLVVLILVLIMIFKNDDTNECCNDDCEHCPFPMCDRSKHRKK